jgi:hypothetical protein
MPIKANSPIFMLTVKPANNSKYLNKSIQPKLHFRLRTLMREGFSSPQCAYWAFSSNSNSRQKSGSTRGRWSSKGCEMKAFHPPQKYKLSYDYINCSCDRAIGIAVLMDVTANEVIYYLKMQKIHLNTNEGNKSSNNFKNFLVLSSRIIGPNNSFLHRSNHFINIIGRDFIFVISYSWFGNK